MEGAELTGFYRLLYPAGIVLVTSIDAKGKPNIITAAWCMPASFDPPLAAIGIGKTRYSHELIGRGREFVINVPHAGMKEAIMACGTTSGRKTDKFAEAKLTAEKASSVKPPLIAECISALECSVEKEIDAGDHTLFVGKVLAAHRRAGSESEKRLYDAGGRNFVEV